MASDLDAGPGAAAALRALGHPRVSRASPECAEADTGAHKGRAAAASVLLSLVGQVGALAQAFQWRGEAGATSFSASEKQQLAQELGDALLQLARLADACGVDLGGAVLDCLASGAAAGHKKDGPCTAGGSSGGAGPAPRTASPLGGPRPASAGAAPGSPPSLSRGLAGLAAQRGGAHSLASRPCSRGVSPEPRLSSGSGAGGAPQSAAGFICGLQAAGGRLSPEPRGGAARGSPPGAIPSPGRGGGAPPSPPAAAGSPLAFGLGSPGGLFGLAGAADLDASSPFAAARVAQAEELHSAKAAGLLPLGLLAEIEHGLAGASCAAGAHARQVSIECIVPGLPRAAGALRGEADAPSPVVTPGRADAPPRAAGGRPRPDGAAAAAAAAAASSAAASLWLTAAAAGTGTGLALAAATPRGTGPGACGAPGWSFSGSCHEPSDGSGSDPGSDACAGLGAPPAGASSLGDGSLGGPLPSFSSYNSTAASSLHAGSGGLSSAGGSVTAPGCAALAAAAAGRLYAPGEPGATSAGSAGSTSSSGGVPVRSLAAAVAAAAAAAAGDPAGAALASSYAAAGGGLTEPCPRCGGLHTGKCPPRAKCVRCLRRAHMGECWSRCLCCNLIHAPGKCRAAAAARVYAPPAALAAGGAGGQRVGGGAALCLPDSLLDAPIALAV
ncbi:hypothetical protein HT031_004490 [Scenedesmus sp. PABB004]|nr:hypothetical protein HT031_004490 [Scenedesmus sp. PABB004]